MHVLIVAFHYPPDRAVGALRPARMAEAFQRAGHRVSVITARLSEEEERARGTTPGEEVSVVDVPPSPRDIYLRGKRLLRQIRRGSDAGDQVPAARDSAVSSNGDPVPLWKRSLSALLWLPDDRQGFIPAAAAAARRVHRGAAVDLLITTAPPFSVHLAGLLIQRFTGAKWVADFRDPWTDNPCRTAATRTAVTDRIELWLERSVTRRADLVVSASAGIERFFADSSVPSEKRLLVRNGIDHLGTRPPRERMETFRILHMGTFYHGRDPRPFLDALALLRDGGRPGADRIEVTFVGSSRTYAGESIEAMVAERSLAGIVRFQEFVPREHAIAMAAEADLLLLLAQDQPDQVPQKLYEYLGTRVPILAFADEGGESAMLLEAAGGHYLVTDGTPATAAAALEAALAAERMPAGNHDVLERLTAAAQLQRLMDRLDVHGNVDRSSPAVGGGLVPR